MNKLTIALMFSAGDAPKAETLLDWIYQLSGKTQNDNPLLLVAASNVHPEMHTKVRLAGEMGFKHVELVVANSTDAEKVISFNRLFRATAQTVMNNYRSPFLLLEPDCVPLKANWLDHLQLSYDSQPKRFLGPHLKFQVRDEEKMCVGKISVYPNNAITDLNGYFDSIVSFNQLAGDFILPRSTKSRLIQQLDVLNEEDFNKVRPDAVLLHSDKTGSYLRHLRNAFTLADSNGVNEPIPSIPMEVPASQSFEGNQMLPEGKIDGRTKAARERKAALATH